MAEHLPDVASTQPQLSFTHKVIKEAMRHRSPATLVSRLAKQDVIMNCSGDRKIALPAGSRVSVCLSAAHHNDLNFYNPNEFDPERFNEEPGEHKNPAGYLTFSAGPRMCPGERVTMMWLSMLTALVVKEFELRAIPDTDPFDFQHARKFVAWCLGGVNVQIRPRNRTADA